MKELLKFITNKITLIGLILLLSVGLVNQCTTTREYKPYKAKYNNLVHSIDSIKAIPNDTIIVTDTIIKSDTIIKHHTEYVDLPKEYNVYSDSIKNDTIDVEILIKADNVYSIDWEYKPVYIYKDRIITKHIPSIITEPCPDIVEKKRKTALYLNTGVMYLNNNYSPSIGASLNLNKININYHYTIYNNNNNLNNIHLVSLGWKIRLRSK